MAHTPFKQKVEERSQVKRSEAEQPAKRQCSHYEKQIQKLPPGDLGLVKEPVGYFSQIYIYIYTHLHIYTYIYICFHINNTYIKSSTSVNTCFHLHLNRNIIFMLHIVFTYIFICHKIYIYIYILYTYIYTRHI